MTQAIDSTNSQTYMIDTSLGPSWATRWLYELSQTRLEDYKTAQLNPVQGDDLENHKKIISDVLGH